MRTALAYVLGFFTGWFIVRPPVERRALAYLPPPEHMPVMLDSAQIARILRELKQ